ncbi:phytanoyl-CoA dioxygenase family protein [Streptoalloteichus hindustanus]|uniref:phytanoyl-CoA dioxygenase family protein n=1 Tax=Streptoalloteichus hindustanus TaxID=2017 RepID=UPI001F365EFE|nr:phytanoyl-CoA dioxygenase family protein [Streptoalloteichus hindustanus]
MPVPALTDDQVERFVTDGFVHLAGAFPRELADAGRALLWRATGLDPDDPATWTQPVVRLGGFADEPFRLAANTPVLHSAFDQLVGAGRWVPRHSLGTFPVRFPSDDDPGDAGWHVEASFLTDDGSAYRLNLRSRGRALLMLFLFSDISEDDAPTRIRVGSHLDVPALLAPAGDEGVDPFAFGPVAEAATAHRPLALATGAAGDVYLCHPFLVHAAQPHRGTVPRFMAQPPLDPAGLLDLDRADGDYSPVERAVRRGLGLSENGR